MSKMPRGLLVLYVCLFVFYSPILWAQEEIPEEVGDGEGLDQPKAAIYLPIKPQFVVNYGGGARLKYLKTMVTVRVASSEAASSVRHHMPYIRNNLVLLFASQTDETLSSQEGKEAMRQAALGVIRELLEREDELPPEDVLDVLFNSLTWH